MPSINSRSNIDHVLNNSESECIRRLRSRKSSLSRRAPIGCVPLPNWGVGRRSARPIGTAGNAHQLPEDCKMASWKDLHFWKKNEWNEMMNNEQLLYLSRVWVFDQLWKVADDAHGCHEPGISTPRPHPLRFQQAPLTGRFPEALLFIFSFQSFTQTHTQKNSCSSVPEMHTYSYW